MCFDIINGLGVDNECDGQTDEHRDRRTERTAVSNIASLNALKIYKRRKTFSFEFATAVNLNLCRDKLNRKRARDNSQENSAKSNGQ